MLCCFGKGAIRLPSWPKGPKRCRDCKESTIPTISGGDLRDLEGRCEFYMVKDSVWAQAGMKWRGYLCGGCLETRIGRRLRKRDFAPSLAHTFYLFLQTARLRSRINGRVK